AAPGRGPAGPLSPFPLAPPPIAAVPALCRGWPMPHFPPFDRFAELARSHTVVPVYRQLTGDTLTPVSAFCKIQEGDWAFLFESVVGGERIGRYSFLRAGPFLTIEAYNHGLDVRRAGA